MMVGKKEEMFSIERENKIPNNKSVGYNFKWLYNEQYVGDMVIFNNDFVKGSANIGSYELYGIEFKGMGYIFIKLCIENLLDENYFILSQKSYRNPLSNKIWDKLKNDYCVTDETICNKEFNKLIRKV